LAQPASASELAVAKPTMAMTERRMITSSDLRVTTLLPGTL
jgi:hypothetical protein